MPTVIDIDEPLSAKRLPLIWSLFSAIKMPNGPLCNNLAVVFKNNS
jgi:hypothetical protein